ncbi:hypothetical protein [Micromonospora avicenniae]|uniref:Uncharacterized protein n=1 Tax=Micromonospora avicenniae TaxID=1198245 RepID=A0A1N7FJH6_9ACTN|nr:hypothetical protein [Micromonospora avicenniae]SIS00473.1 hypothetical protein SAMN05444858_13814 [Micromonospora avicenniae]
MLVTMRGRAAKHGWLVATSAIAVLATSACQYVAPSDDIYTIGVARIGDQLHVYAPVCENERIDVVQVYDNEAASRESNFDPDSNTHTYWKVSGPTDALAEQGWIAIGDDSAYRTVIVSAGSSGQLPQVVGVTLKVDDPRGESSVGGAFEVGKVPEYAAGADPKTVKYGYRLGSKKQELLGADEIRNRSKCAREYYRR